MGATGLALIKSFEGCRLEAYQDSVGIWTIGYGHTGPEVKPGLEISLDRAEELLRLNLVEAEGAVCRFVTAPLNQNQFDALCCFTYNVGTGKFKSSTLCLLTNMREYFKAADEFLKWDKAGGVPLLGLARRRKAERELFLRPLDVNANKS
jgi:lysozyme